MRQVARSRPGQFETLEADAVVLALGQETDSGFLKTRPRHRLHDRMAVMVGTDMMTGRAGIFAGGDMVPANARSRSQSATASGQRDNIDAWLQRQGGIRIRSRHP